MRTWLPGLLILFVFAVLPSCQQAPNLPTKALDSQQEVAAPSITAEQQHPPAQQAATKPSSPQLPPGSLAEARHDFTTKLTERKSAHEPVPEPPPELFQLIKYRSPVGELAAYLSPDPRDGMKHPAIIWITGGDCNTIGDVWSPMPPENDQTAAAFRKAGMIMMFPSLRGGNENPGFNEGFLGEVDDVIAAAEHLAKQEFVDPTRIYLGGHSTGGTLVLLVAECTDRFRAVFSFGPADNIRGYGVEMLPFDFKVPKEFEVRDPSRWLSSIRSQVFIFEGTVNSNILSLRTLAKLSRTNPNVTALAKKGADHFSILAPTTELIAEKLIQHVGDGPISITQQELNAN